MLLYFDLRGTQAEVISVLERLASVVQCLPIVRWQASQVSGVPGLSRELEVATEASLLTVLFEQQPQRVSKVH
jgi:hypothetical protein